MRDTSTSPGCGGFADAMGEMDGDASELGAAPFDFAGVDPDADVEADLAGGITDRRPAADRSGWTVERGEHAVSCEILLVAREPFS